MSDSHSFSPRVQDLALFHAYYDESSFLSEALCAWCDIPKDALPLFLVIFFLFSETRRQFIFSI